MRKTDRRRQGKHLRVLQVTPSVAPQDGGPSVGIMALNRALRSRGIAVYICSTDADGRHGRISARDKLPFADVRFFRAHWPHRLKASIGMAVFLYPHIRGADVVHVHYTNSWPSFVATMYCRILNKTYVVQPHGGLEPYHMAKSSRTKAIFELLSGTIRNAAALILATETEAARIKAVPQSRKFVLPLGALPAAPDSSMSREEGPQILFLGRLAHKKRLDILLHAWVQVVREIPAAQLHVVGPDTDGLLDGYRRLVASLGVQRAVRFSGLLLGEEKRRAFADAAIFALPSENESFGIAVAEALSAGLPVVVSEHVAIADEIKTAGAGVVVPSLEPDEWAQELTALLQDGTRRLTMSVAARRLASERYSWEKAALRLEQLYRTLLGQGTTRNGRMDGAAR